MKNLFKENRLVFMSPGGPSRAPQPKGIENAESAEQALQIMTPKEAKEAGRTARDKISRLADKVKGNKELHKKLVDLDKKLDKAMGDVDATEKEQTKAIGSTILELNKVIDTKLPDVRKQILDSSAQVLGKGKYHGQKFLNSMVSAFSMMKVKDEYKKREVTLKRDGNKLFLNGVQYDFSSDNIAGKITWHVKQKDTPISGVYDPIDVSGKEVKQVKTETLASKMEEGQPAPKTKPKAAPKTVAKKAPEKGKEVKEGPTNQLLAETFRTISNPDVHGQELTAAQLSALKSFTNSVGRGEVRHFKHGKTETYVARSKDGAVWQISTIVKDSHGDTASGTKYYAPRATSAISHKLPKQYEGKVQFPETPGFTIKADTRIASKPKPKIDTNEPKPDPKILKMFKDQARKAEQAKYLKDGMKEWTDGVKKAVAAVVKSLKWLSKAKALSKDIQAAKGCSFQEATKIAVKFKSRCEQCDRDLTLKDMSPDDVIGRLRSAVSVLPTQVRANYAAKFKIDEGKTRLASLKKGIPASAIARKSPEPSYTKPSAKPAETVSKSKVPALDRAGKTITKADRVKLAQERGLTREQYDQMMEKNVKEINSKLKKLKTGGVGVSISLHDGSDITIYRSSKDKFYYHDSSDKKITFSIGDGAFVRNLAQLVSKKPEYVDTFKPVDVRDEAPKKKVASKPKSQPKSKGETYEVKSQFSSKDIKKSNEITEKGKETFVKQGQQLLSMIENGDILNPKKIASLAKDIMGKINEACFDNNLGKYIGQIKSPSGKLQLNISLNLLSKHVTGIINISDGKNEDLLYDTDFLDEVPMTKRELNKFAIISPRENRDIQESVGELKKMLEGKALADVVRTNGQDLKDYIAHIAGVHKRKNIPGNYNITEGYNMSVSKDGIVKLSQKGETRVVRYTPPTEQANA